MTNCEKSIEYYISVLGTTRDLEAVKYLREKDFSEDQIGALRTRKKEGMSVKNLTQITHSFIPTEIMKAGGVY